MSVLGVAGAGTMGSGIAQLAALAGYETLLFDPSSEAREAALERIRGGLEKGTERGRWSNESATAAADLLRPVSALGELGSAEFVIEAAPEDLALKRDIFEELASACAVSTILATNTSSIPVTAIAASVEDPSRVVGMHFFNPPPLMPLVEVIPGLETSEATVAAARSVAEEFGKHVIVAKDVPGFLVNRCGRPLYGEGLRLLSEGVASVEQIDRACRVGGGFRMGPFELMDLVGIDVAFDVARSFYERSFGEPRWRPNPLQERMVQSGNLGRKSGRGWYRYEPGEKRKPDPEPPAAGSGEGRDLSVVGRGFAAEPLRRLALAAGFVVRAEPSADAEVSFFCGEPGAELGSESGGAVAVSCESRSLASWESPEAIGFSLPLGDSAPYVELTRGVAATEPAAEAAERVLRDCGLSVEWTGDGPSLLLGRILAQLVNEGAFAVGEGVGSAEEVDAAAELGLNYPFGPFALGERLGWRTALERLEGIWSERREERYRTAPQLIAMATKEGENE